MAGAAATDRDDVSAATGVPGLVAWAMEVVLMIMVVAAPWMYGAVHPGFELVLDVGLTVLLGLWAIRMLWQRQLLVARCPVTILLAVLLLLGLWQITPLPDRVLDAVAPSTAALYRRLLPTVPESLPDPTVVTEAAPPSRTISLTPDATRNYCFHLLSVLLVFAVVRNNLARPGVLTRLAIVLVANGFALCLFGVIQRLTSPRNMLYWTYPSLGQVFGPFVSRNMFPYYVNMCIGLGVGLILARAGRQAPEPTPGRRTPSWLQGRETVGGALTYWLHDPPSQWLLAAVAFMSSTVAFTLSRGGVAAMLGGLLFAVALGGTPRGRAVRVAGLALLAGLGLFFLAWLGMPLVEERLRTLAEPERADQARVPLWLRVLPLVPQFPAWGTGLGSFQYVEVWSRQELPIVPEADPGKPQPLESSLFDHAHNDFVEMAVEAGIPGLVVLLAIIFLVFRCGLRAVARSRSGRTAGLATGVLCGLTAVVIHSFVDFGMHAPAIALLATVLGAMVCGMASRDPGPVWRLKLWGLAPVGGAVIVVLLGLMLCAHTWQAHRIERLQAAAANVAADTADRRRLQLLYLEAAARLAPHNGAVRLELAQARLDLLQTEVASIERLERLGVLGDYFMLAPSAVPPMAAGFPAVVISVSSDAHWVARNELLDQAREQATRKHLYQALAQYIAARNANPLMPEPHLTLGLYAQALQTGDRASAYFDRVKFLAPRLPEVWYYSGSEELAAGRKDQAWKDWRKCLSLTDRYLDLILYRSARLLEPAELVAKVLPERPELLVKAATRLYPRDNQWSARAPFLRAALTALEQQTEPLSAAQLKMQMQLQRQFQMWPAAQQTARQLLALQPLNYEVRLELAELYFLTKDYEKAMTEVRAVRTADPRNVKAEALFQRLQKLPDSGDR
jgi:O-antigen ligase/tetratricopeptide (TPR) repeat protein